MKALDSIWEISDKGTSVAPYMELRLSQIVMWLIIAIDQAANDLDEPLPGP